MPEPKSKLVESEGKVLAFWQKENIFKKSLKGKSKDFVFYDGPPFATGTPHYGHFLASFIKDTIPRYKAMRGYKVTRRWGWDCHGLPVENLIEKELGLKSKKDIVDYGVDKFNTASRDSVLRYANEWRTQIPRIGRWVDMDDDYRTMDASYTESVWWVFKSLFDKGLVYEGFKSMQVCPRCETTLSNFEVNLGYKDITDISVYVALESKKEKGTYFLAWTTTPWTLPGNVALAVGADIDYARVTHAGKTYIVARDRVADVFAGKEHNLVSVMKGSDLVGTVYTPIFDYYVAGDTKNLENGFKVCAADFVTTTDGTGIVHIAPAFGEDDMKLGEREKLPFIQHVGMDGKFRPEVRDFAGLDVKPKGAADEKDPHQKTDVEVIKWLAHNGHLFEKKKIIHSYPHCWRCDTPLLNYAASSWFVKVTAFKDKLVAANKKVSWTPEDIRDGRFGKWLEGARDWAISRSRFWGAPIPVWKAKTSGKLYPVGSLAELKKLVKRSGNTYTLMRHGEAESNVLGISNSDHTKKYHLTDNGKEQTRARAKELKKTGIDLIIASDFMRTEETARIVAEELGIPAKDIVYDVRLREYNVGPEREGKPWRSTEDYVREHGPYPGMETPASLKKRVFAAMYDIDRKYQGKKILIISHGSPLNTIMNGITNDIDHEEIMHETRSNFRHPAEVHTVDFARLPHNDDYDLDLHRPYIDKVECVAPGGEVLVRVPEVFDCWFESGSMPYGEAHYIGKAKPHFNPKGILGGLFNSRTGFPADFIAEGVDQTRGWFYSMMVLGTGLFGTSPFKNVIVNGIILAENGEKMSKRLKNYPDPMEVVDKYGADALRYYLLSSPVVAAQDVRFSEKGVDEVSKKLLQRLDNVVAFYELYASRDTAPVADSTHVLDRWIRARLAETAAEVGRQLDRYQLDKASRPLMSFVDDLSTWYLRRSRDRFKSEDVADKALAQSDRALALGTTRHILREFAKVSAPFLPFYAENLWGRVKEQSDIESVHLAEWPEYGTGKKVAQADADILASMSLVRSFASMAHMQRSAAKIPVRQPLAKLIVKHDGGEPAYWNDLRDILKDEANVKEVMLIEGVAEVEKGIELDTIVTAELKKEGVVRDLIRSVQDLRKTEGLTIGDKVMLLLESDEKGKELVHAYLADIKRVTLVTGVEYAHLPNATALEVEGYSFKVGFKK
ncbi:MAG: class I tRNA ligase family protein [bacterium]|nr:class I tRNA ligase family protein [bacterium]